MIPDKKTALLWFVGACVLFPLFIQLSGGIYNDRSSMIDSLGLLTKLPLPVSLFACLAIFVFLPGNLQRVRAALAMIACVVSVSLVSVWFGWDSDISPQRKLLLIAQTLLPLAGLLLGQLIEDPKKIIAYAFLVVISVVVPLQLLATWAQGGLILTHYLYVFSIYSHFQYVTLIFVCAYIFCLVSLWDQHKMWLCATGLAVLIYAVSGLSFLTIFAYFAFISVFILWKFFLRRPPLAVVAAAAVLIGCALWGGYSYFAKMGGQRSSVEGLKPLFHGKFIDLFEGKIPTNVQERFDDWKLFGKGITESKTTLLVGHAQPMPREIKSSPHNLYVDIVYTFGVLGLLPLLGLMGYTASLCLRQRKSIPAETWWLVAIVFYLVVVDSNFKVTLRQPYPGIFAYFLWGLLLTRLHVHDKTARAG